MRILGYDISLILDKYASSDGAWIPDRAIVLREGMTRAQEEQTVLHEIVHATGDLTGVELDEKEVTAIASVLYAIFCDNGVSIRPLLREIGNANK